MPTYEYRCQTCELNFDIMQPFSEDTLAKCPTKKSGKSPAGCTSPGRGKVSKVFSAPGITFKGDGFYKTDSRPKSGATSDSSSKSTAKDSAKSDSSSASSDKQSDKPKKSADGGSKKSETTAS